MAAERELLTVALGNYASLVAAQWANGTTQFDTSRRTLYTERRVETVRGGAATQQRTGAPVRVPRMILLDAPHATQIKFFRRSTRMDTSANEEHEVGHDVSFGGMNHTTEGDAFSSASSASLDADDNNVGDGNNNNSGGGQERGWVEELQASDEHHHHHCSSFSQGAGAAHGMCTSIKCIKRELFNEHDEVVPWWQYIRSGVCEDCVHVLHPLHSLGGNAGDVPLLHSFGFGMSQLRSSRSHDIAEVMGSMWQQLEEADSLQGVQCFLDGDSAFGGAACNVMEEFWEDAGKKIPAVFFTCFQPLPEEVTASESEVGFADRRKDEMCLNRLLATSHLTQQDCAVYLPLELGQWESAFAEHTAAGVNNIPSWLRDDTATAQLVAMAADTALYGVRDDGSVNATAASGPAFYLHDWQEAVRPTRTMRVAAALAAVPLRVYDANYPRNDLWDLLQRYPLLSTSEVTNGGLFAPLTHPITLDAQTDAGRVLGHALTLRGAGKLHDLTYPRQEALLRYAMPLRTVNYLPLVTGNSYPISSTFPQEFVLPRDVLASGVLDGIDVGFHAVSTFGSAPMIQEILTEAEKVLYRRRHLYEETYDMDSEEWKEVLEDVLQIRDDYDHRGNHEEEGEGYLE
ncbi:hypothetical protein TraAM80_03318 [Trypanosoma rangeli]|uniref:Tubulin/FtsZ family, GTPase domain containing protein n=1 Tax=Trypanosoma rangeli TaxID=5698 RepID=A0A3R7MKD9_TRYRA|nr:uncharacterized protein TraAM80_03318 [Trypanosoma rangeli]RNF07406.1 hypothetical protein TraAM80_03318 [Trypanosoma rangeli]|eukprot:RNF07406.1 hypothetical protein TraAM80_03318 [Trypanosoma rangeli]